MTPLHSILVFAFFFTGVVLFFLGVIILRESPRQRINRSTGLLMLFVSAGALASTFGALLPSGGGLEWRNTFLLGISLIWELFFPSLLYFALVFPRETRILQRFPKAVLLIYLPHLFQVILLSLFPTVHDFHTAWNLTMQSEFWNVALRPMQLLWAILLTLTEQFYDRRESIFALLNLAYILAANVIMSRSQAKLTDASVRKQVGWVVWGVRLAVAFYALAYIVPHLSSLIVHEKARQWLTILSLFTGLSTIAWAILRYQFLSARFVIRPGLVFSLAAGLTAGLYLWIFSAARRYLVLLYDVNLPIFEMMFLIVALFFFQPVNSAIDKLVDKVLRRRPRDYYETMQSISRDIYTHLETPKLRTIILNALAESLDAAPLHLLMCDQNKNLCAELSLASPAPFFRCDGELAQALGKAAQPVRVDRMRMQITDQTELRNLDLLQAVLLAPLRHHAKLLGMVAIGPKRNGKAFTSQDKALLDVFCSQVAVALENAQLYKLLSSRQQWEEEIAVAREIHQMLLPAEPPQGHTCRVTMMALPSKEVGGDFLDFVRRDDRHLGMSIGDISGKGFAGSLLMSNLQACFRAAAYRLPQPHEVVTEVNKQLTRTTAAGKYATLVYAVLDEEQHVLRYCNAGHNYPILRSRSGAVRRLLESDPLVGLDQQIVFHTHEVQLADGDCVVFYTDGLTEALDVNTVEYGEQRFMQTISACPHTEASAMLRYIYEDVSQWAAGASQYDDMTMIILQMM